MDFHHFGQKSFVQQAGIQGFVDHLEQGRVMANRCVSCQKNQFPPKSYCSICGADTMEWIEIAGAGRLMTFTTVHYGPSGFETEVPYTLGVVDFPYGFKVFGQIDKHIPKESIHIGMALRVIPIRLNEGRVTYRFESA